MSDHAFGIERRRAGGGVVDHAPAARFMVLIVDATGVTVARLFDAQRREVAEFDAGTQEVSVMTQGLVPERGADGPAWDHALRGSSATERAAAVVYTLDV